MMVLGKKCIFFINSDLFVRLEFNDKKKHTHTDYSIDKNNQTYGMLVTVVQIFFCYFFHDLKK